MECYSNLADEVVIVNGGNTDDIDLLKTNWSTMLWEKWPIEFEWSLIGKMFQRGYEASTGDWVIRADLDMIFHENDFKAIRKACEDNNDVPALSFWKWQFVQPDRYNLKSRLVTMVNKRDYGDRIRFDSGGDLCQVSLDGKYLSPSDVPEARVPIYNYEKLLKTKEQIMDDQGRMERAYKRHFGKYQLAKNDTDESAYKGWLEMSLGRYNKPQEQIPLKAHPKYVQKTIKNLKPNQFGHSAFGNLKKNNYVKQS